MYRSSLLFPRPLDKALGSFGNILDSNSLLWLLDPLLDHDVQPIVTNACAALYRLAHGQVSFRCNPNGLEGADRTAVRRCEVRQSLFPITKRRLRRRSADRLSFRVHSRAIDAPRTPSATNRIKPRCGAYNRKENIMSNTQPTLILQRQRTWRGQTSDLDQDRRRISAWHR